MVVSYSSGGFGAQVLGGEQKRAFARERGQERGQERVE
jgi:hypothetical protein